MWPFYPQGLEQEEDGSPASAGGAPGAGTPGRAGGLPRAGRLNARPLPRIVKGGGGSQSQPGFWAKGGFGDGDDVVTTAKGKHIYKCVHVYIYMHVYMYIYLCSSSQNSGQRGVRRWGRRRNNGQRRVPFIYLYIYICVYMYVYIYACVHVYIPL